jgi:hypothetical protein
MISSADWANDVAERAIAANIKDNNLKAFIMFSFIMQDTAV